MLSFFFKLHFVNNLLSEPGGHVKATIIFTFGIPLLIASNNSLHELAPFYKL